MPASFSAFKLSVSVRVSANFSVYFCDSSRVIVLLSPALPVIKLSFRVELTAIVFPNSVSMSTLLSF